MLMSRNQKWVFALTLLLAPHLFSPNAGAESPSDGAEKATSRRLLSSQPLAEIGAESRPAKMEWYRWKLVVLARRLDRDLDRFETATQWRSFLRLPEEFSSLPTEAKIGSLQTLCKRFDGVAAAEQYQPVATMPSFQSMRDALDNYLVLLEKSAAPGRKIPLASENVSSNKLRQIETQDRLAQKTPVHRLPPVLTPGRHPDLLTPPSQDGSSQ